MVCLPYYRVVRERFKDIKATRYTVDVPYADKIERARIWENAAANRPQIYFLIDAPALFDRAGGLYRLTPSTAVSRQSPPLRFFSRAVLEAAKALKFQPDIVHGHDWQVGPLMAYLKLSLSR